MMIGTRNKLLLIIVSGILFYCIFLLDLYSHEYAHSRIAIEYGCINSTIDVSLNGDGSHKCNEYIDDRTELMKLEESRLHMVNEIVNYNSMKFVVLIMYIFLAMIVIG